MPRPVFISYSQADGECARELVDVVEAAGIACWIAPRDVSPSAEWAAEIIDAISAAKVMVLVFSANSNGSPQVSREVERAVHKQLAIVPFRIDDVLPAKSLEYFLSAQHWLDAFAPPRAPHYESLCRHLRRLLESREAAPPPERQSPSIGAEALRQVERRLARDLGPVARLLVKRAAAQTLQWDDMARELAGALDGEAQRREFLESCRAIAQTRPNGGSS
ncbi:MAG TPA: toll/interleukin-1 receptor domain-containing protein [Steroidobacteraceae bacterium]|nr:toll/interleukin-1 receptor domain-containing protein [Steroidobacteraceae bacterium]